jgi:hypothetical protein
VVKSNERLLLQELTRWVLYSAILSLVILSTLYIYLSWNNPENFVVISEKMVKEIVIQLIPLTLIFLISSLVLKRYTELKDYVETTEQTERYPTPGKTGS